MVLLTNPLWLVKTRMQLQVKTESSTVKPYRNLVDAFRTIFREEGVFAFYKGGVPALMLVSHGAVQFVAYERLKVLFPSSAVRKKMNNSIEDDLKPNVFERLQDSGGYLAMGATSKVIASTVTYPIQVIKSRMQQRSQGLEIVMKDGVTTNLQSFEGREYKSVVECVQRIWKNEGGGGFFKGCLPNAFRVAPNAAITFVVYETCMDVKRG